MRTSPPDRGGRLPPFRRGGVWPWIIVTARAAAKGRRCRSTNRPYRETRLRRRRRWHTPTASHANQQGPADGSGSGNRLDRDGKGPREGRGLYRKLARGSRSIRGAASSRRLSPGGSQQGVGKLCRFLGPLALGRAFGGGLRARGMTLLLHLHDIARGVEFHPAQIAPHQHDAPPAGALRTIGRIGRVGTLSGSKPGPSSAIFDPELLGRDFALHVDPFLVVQAVAVLDGVDDRFLERLSRTANTSWESHRSSSSSVERVLDNRSSGAAIAGNLAVGRPGPRPFVTFHSWARRRSSGVADIRPSPSRGCRQRPAPAEPGVRRRCAAGLLTGRSNVP